jgi:hypothetical protein
MRAGFREGRRLGSFGFYGFSVGVGAHGMQGSREGLALLIKQLNGRISGRGEVHVHRRWFGKGFRLAGNEGRRGFSEQNLI